MTPTDALLFEALTYPQRTLVRQLMRALGKTQHSKGHGSYAQCDHCQQVARVYYSDRFGRCCAKCRRGMMRDAR